VVVVVLVAWLMLVDVFVLGMVVVRLLMALVEDVVMLDGEVVVLE
jgi:hypothetical protein